MAFMPSDWLYFLWHDVKYEAMRTELVYNQICPFRTTLFASITTHI